MSDAKETTVSNTFETLMRQQRKGLMGHELSLKLQELTRACAAHLKPGKLVLTLTVTPCAADGSAMTISDNIALKAPEASKGSSIFYALETGELVRENPEQQTFDLKVVTTTAVKELQVNA